jgi:hypothetical protein
MRRIPQITTICTLVLLGCAGASPGPEPLTGTIIGPAGGDFSFLNGAIVLHVPAGALAKDIGVTAVTTTPPLDPAAIRNLGYTLSASGDVQFLSDVTVDLKFDPALGPLGVPTSHMRGHQLSAGAWAVMAGDNTVNTSTNTVTFRTRTLGTFGVKRVPPDGGCSAAQHRQFDFWVGEWTIGPTQESSITSDGCAIFEHYRPGGGTFGKSISVYDEMTGKWHQTYLFSVSPAPLLLSGSFQDGKMVMFDIRGGVIFSRWTWTQQGSNVLQTSENSSNNGASYSPGFSGLYVKKP